MLSVGPFKRTLFRVPDHNRVSKFKLRAILTRPSDSLNSDLRSVIIGSVTMVQGLR